MTEMQFYRWAESRQRLSEKDAARLLHSDFASGMFAWGCDNPMPETLALMEHECDECFVPALAVAIRARAKMEVGWLMAAVCDFPVEFTLIGPVVGPMKLEGFVFPPDGDWAKWAEDLEIVAGAFD